MLVDFECPKCARRIELDKKLDDRTLPLCCEEGCDVEMQRVISAPPFHLKGGRWAKDGYSR